MLVGFAAVCLISPVAYALDTVILAVTLNSVSQGEFFLKQNDEGNLLMRVEDLRQIGLKTGTVPVTTIDTEPYVSFNDMEGVTATLDEKLLQLNLQAGIAWVDLPSVVRDFSSFSSRYVPSTDTSAFLNYRADYGNGNDSAVATWTATGQTGLRRGNLLFLGDGFYQQSEGTHQVVRLMTSLSWDRPDTLSRWVAGDISASAGDPSGPIIMGGLSYASAFSMAPGMSTYPTGEFEGVALLPSEAEIYVNGVLVRREHLAPGDYRFKNLPVSNGANNVEILLRDSFGNESRSSDRFYLSDRLLQAGLHDYSYNLGFIRGDYGIHSNDYGVPVLVARHTSGVNDYLTLGAGIEAGDGLINLNPRVVLGLAQMGVLNLLWGADHDRDLGYGTTAAGGYNFQSRYINYQLSVRHNSRNYRTLVNREAIDTTRLEIGTGISLGTPRIGTFNLNATSVDRYAGEVIRSLGASYTRSLATTVQLSASWSTTWGRSVESTFFAGLTWFPMKESTASATLQTGSGVERETLSLQKNLPVGEGVGYQATVERSHIGDRTIYRANPNVQYNGPYGSYSADVQGQTDEQNGHPALNYQLSASGALVYANGHAGPGRPVSGSFAVVQVEGLSNVMVLLDNQEIARTDANGMAYLNGLRSYQENLIAFDDSQIAPNYLIKRYSTIVTPGLYGGKCVSFPVARVQGYGGRLMAQDGTPLEYAQVTIHGTGQEFRFSTLSNGEFYFENLVDMETNADKRNASCGQPSPYQRTVMPGMYAVTVENDMSERHFNLLIPASDDMFVLLGDFRLPDSLKPE